MCGFFYFFILRFYLYAEKCKYLLPTLLFGFDSLVLLYRLSPCLVPSPMLIAHAYCTMYAHIILYDVEVFAPSFWRNRLTQNKGSNYVVICCRSDWVKSRIEVLA